MPYVPTTPTVLLCSQLATVVQSAWSPTDGASGAGWDFFRRYGDADNVSVPALAGRQVVFFPHGYEWENAVRAGEWYTHHVQCLVAERYTAAAGDPPASWTGARVDFVHQYIVQGLRYTKAGPAPFNPLLWSLKTTVQVVDLEKLIGGGRLFYALIDLEFQELVSP